MLIFLFKYVDIFTITELDLDLHIYYDYLDLV